MSLNHIRRHAPLVHCISNIVVANFKANGLLAIGASPVMADAPEEVAQMVAIAGVLSINMGTLNSESVKAMLAAGRAANALNKPVVFDPVGAGATEFRRNTVRELMREFIERQRQTREYDAFLRAKVDTARAQIASGQYASDADVEARFAARRSALRAKVGGADA